MFEALTQETLLTGAILGASALALVGGVSMMLSPRKAPSRVDVEEAVLKAPYHRLHNVLPKGPT
ncbi:MAG: hypothetical protein AAF999_06905 [Pseudomonadota bacterium]